ncbi:MAG: twin-arginine translocation signal domain-containing protein, partial [Magnetococcales bacterium]|nr:twin-arginine translocation signal domain-containing protein [Magnetococcales bacterium]
MKRRDFLQTVGSGVLAAGVGMGLPQNASAGIPLPSTTKRPKFRQTDLTAYLNKVRQFNEDHPGDIFLSEN